MGGVGGVGRVGRVRRVQRVRGVRHVRVRVRVRPAQRDVGQRGRGEEQLGGARARLLLLADGGGGAGRRVARRAAIAVCIVTMPNLNAYSINGATVYILFLG